MIENPSFSVYIRYDENIDVYLTLGKCEIMFIFVGKFRLHYIRKGSLRARACRMAYLNNNIDWNYPRRGFGVQFRLA